jgi:hypothetical protein
MRNVGKIQKEDPNKHSIQFIDENKEKSSKRKLEKPEDLLANKVKNKFNLKKLGEKEIKRVSLKKPFYFSCKFY